MLWFLNLFREQKRYLKEAQMEKWLVTGNSHHGTGRAWSLWYQTYIRNSRDLYKVRKGPMHMNATNPG